MRRQTTLLLPLLALPLAAACGADPVGDIDRTQANLVDKSMFTGEWYTRTTTVDVPYQTSFTFIGDQGLSMGTPRIRWEIRKDLLIAFKVADTVASADDDWRTRRIRLPDGSWEEVYSGSVLATFNIVDHVDVQREYNPVTGEQTNVVVENTTDKPWYERQFMRVDWLAQTAWWLYSEQSLLSYYPQPHQVDDPGAAEIEPDHVSIVNNVLVVPEGAGPCNVYAASAGSCAASTVKFRYDFLRVPYWEEYLAARELEEERVAAGELREQERVTRSYDDFVSFYYFEPVRHDDVLQDKFGFFRSERYSYDADRGTTYEGRQLNANVWNLWERIRPADALPQRGETPPPVLPYRERDTRRIVYYVNADFPDFLWDEAVAVADGWDRVMRDVVAWLRFHEEYPEILEAECDKPDDDDEADRCKSLRLHGAWKTFPEEWADDAVRIRRLLRVAEWRDGSDAVRDLLGLDGGWQRLIRDLTGDDPESEDYVFPLDGDLHPADLLLEVLAEDGLDDLDGVPPVFITCHTPARAGVDREECFAPDLQPETLKKIGDLRYSFMYWIAKAQSYSPLGYGPNAADPVSGEIVSGTAYVYGAPLETYSTFAREIVDLLNGDLEAGRLITGDNVEVEVLARHDPREVFPPLNTGATDRPVDDAEYRERMREAARSVTPEVYRFLKDPALRAEVVADALPRVDPSYFQSRLDRIRGTWIEDLLITDEVRWAMSGGQVLPGEPVPESLRDVLSPRAWGSPAAVRAARDREMALARRNVLMADFLDDAIWGLAQEMADKALAWEADCQRADSSMTGGALRRCVQGKVRMELMRRIFRGVTEHEVGHTVGLRHNFQGSYDVVNFFDEWAHLKERYAAGRLEPMAPLTKGEKAEKIDEYRYSSIMDYGSRFNSDFHGLGKYDRAALLFAYGGLIEVYADPDSISRKDTEIARHAGLFFHPYMLYDQILGGLANGRRRAVVPYAAVRDEHEREASDSSWTFVEVPYRFQGDEYNGNLGTYTWDAGVDAYEIALDAASRMQQYYLFDAFKRDRFDFGRAGPDAYFSRVLSRYMARLSDVARYDALVSIILPQVYDAELVDYVRKDPLGAGTLTEAMRLSIRVLAETLASPAPGSYRLDEDDGIWRHYSNGFDPEAELTVPVGPGRFPYTTWDSRDGYTYFERPLWIGSFWEKVAAIITLTDSSANFVSEYLDEQDLGGTSIGFNTLHMRQVNDMLGALLIDEFDSYAPVVRGGQVVPRDVLADPGEYSRDDLIEPSLHNFTLKLYAALYGIALLPAGFDQSFIDSLTVFVRGEGPGFEPDGRRTTEFADPFSKKVYVAVLPDLGDDRIPIAYTLVDDARREASQFVSKPAGPERDLLAQSLRDKVELLDLLRSLRDVYGYLDF